MVTLLQATGEHVATTQTDDDGTYAFPLPAAGRYVVTMLHPVTHQAMAGSWRWTTVPSPLDLAAPLWTERRSRSGHEQPQPRRHPACRPGGCSANAATAA